MGACRGGNSPANDAGQITFNDLDCKDRCDNGNACTGYALNRLRWICSTYSSVGATGNGFPQYVCFMKDAGTY